MLKWFTPRFINKAHTYSIIFHCVNHVKGSFLDNIQFLVLFWCQGIFLVIVAENGWRQDILWNKISADKTKTESPSDFLLRMSAENFLRRNVLSALVFKTCQTHVKHTLLVKSLGKSETLFFVGKTGLWSHAFE